MHTAEHLLNSAMVKRYSCGRCFSAHINKKKSKCDYYFDRNLTGREILDLQDEINQQVQNDLKVKSIHMDRRAAQEQYDLGRVPEAADLDTVRIVKIGEYDACPCIGPHVESTRHIGRFEITTTDFNDGVLRIRFKLR